MAIIGAVKGDLTMKHCVGFIGTGEIARIHAESILRLNEGWSIIGGCDLNASVCEDFCNIYGGKEYRNAEELLQDSQIDTVYICTRHDSHVLYSEKACKSGKNVFLEKPVAMNSEEAYRLKNVWIQNPVCFTVGYNMRVTPTILLLKEKLKEFHVIPEAFRANMIGTPFMQGWAGDIKCGGGVLICQGSHMFDLICNVFESRISEVCAAVQWLNQPRGLEPNAATVMLRLENGVCGTLLMNDRGSRSYHVEPGGGMVNITVYSEQGTFDADAYGKLQYGTEEGLTVQIPAGNSELDFRWGYRNEAKSFAELLEGNYSPLCTLEQAVNTAAVVDAARKSASEHCWIPVLYR